MSEPRAHVLWRNRFERDTQRFHQLVKGARLQFAQDHFHLRPTLFNRVQVGGVRWQEFQACAPCGDGVFCRFALMHIEIINQYDIPFSQRGGEDSSHIRFKGFLRHRAFQDPGRTDSAETERGDQGVVLSGIAGRRFGDPLAGGRTPKQPRQTQVRPAFIDEFQMGGDVAQRLQDAALKGLPQLLHPRGVALAVVK
jgi:hypothetical protein